MPYNDENYQLIIASQAGDAQAMEKLIKLHQEAVHSVIYSILGNKDIVEDLAQETFLRMLTAIDRYQFRASFRSWLLRIAVNLCRDQLRRAKVRRIISHFQQNEEMEEIYVDHDQNPLKDLESKEQREYLRKGIKQLALPLRTVLVLRDLQDMTYEEIAVTLHWRIGTVKSRLFRARQELMRFLSSLEEKLE